MASPQEPSSPAPELVLICMWEPAKVSWFEAFLRKVAVWSVRLLVPFLDSSGYLCEDCQFF